MTIRKFLNIVSKNSLNLLMDNHINDENVTKLIKIYFLTFHVVL